MNRKKSFFLADFDREYIDCKYQLQYSSGNNTFLDLIMTKLRSTRKEILPDNEYSVSIFGKTAHLWIHTPACRYSMQGKCTVCNYWKGRKKEGIIKKVVSEVQLPEYCTALLINTCGSCLDERELYIEEQKYLFQWINELSINSVILETHVTTLTEKAIHLIKECISDKELLFEFGQESTNEEVLYYCLNKPSARINIIPIVERIHRYGAKCIINVLFGTPFLREEEQTIDAVNSIKELFEMGIDFVVLFPINVKPNTLPAFLALHDWYTVVSGWRILDVLQALPEELLPMVDVAWYGEHIEENVIPPYFCEECKAFAIGKLTEYNNSDNERERKSILNEMQSKRCHCENEVINQSLKCADTFKERLDILYTFLKEQLIE